MSALFVSGLPDLKDYLPYHQWLPEDDWMDCDLDDVEEWYIGGTYEFWYEGSWLEIEDVEYVIISFYECYFNIPVEFLDGPDGNMIDPEVVMPYFPDYTLNGLFPNMTRFDWEEIFFGEF